MTGGVPLDQSAATVAYAASALRDGCLVALPTETVYGLAADAENAHAVARVYAVKGRPADHPLILHIGSVDQLGEWARDIPVWAEQLVARAWPGPLTVVLPRSSRVGDWVTGGQDTVAIRVPDHPLTLAILAEFGGAVAAPSANRFGRVSPTSAEHVRRDLSGLLGPNDLIIDGGECRVGVESTIVSAVGPAPTILRPGYFSEADVARLCGVTPGQVAEAAPRVSGSLPSHYAPHAKVRVVAEVPLDPGGAVIAMAEVATPDGMVRLMAPTSPQDYARRLYWALREADALAVPVVYAIPPAGEQGAAVAVRDRLSRAAAER